MTKVRRWFNRTANVALAVLLIVLCSFSAPALADYDNTESVEVTTPYVLVESISTRFKKDEATIEQIVDLADKYSYPDFPKRNDILAVILMESGFNLRARNKASKGLMQVNHGSFNMAENMEKGTRMLRELFEALGKPKAALLAYNSGLGNYQKHRYKPTYYTKFLESLSWINRQDTGR